MMEYQAASEVIYSHSSNQAASEVICSHSSNQAYRSAKLRDKFKLERNGVSSAHMHQKAVKNVNYLPQKSRTSPQKQEEKNKADELVRYMSNLPSYLETGEKLKERTFNYGVMEWRRLEKWQYNQKHVPGISCESSPSKSNTNASSFSPSEGSSSSTGGGHNNWSPVRQRMQPNCSSSPGKVSSPGIKSFERNGRKFQDLAASSSNYVKVSQSILSTHKCFHKYTDNRGRDATRINEKRESQEECIHVMSGTEGKKKIKDCEDSSMKEKEVSPCHNQNTVDQSTGPKDGVGCSSFVSPRKSLAGNKEQEIMVARRLSFSDVSDYDTYQPFSDVPHSCPFPREAGKFSDRNQDVKKAVQAFSSSSEVLHQKFNSEEDGKLRSPSPIRRLMAKMVRNSNTKDSSCQSPRCPGDVRSRRAETAVSPADSPSVKSNGVGKGRSSPLRRILDPLLKPRTSNADSSIDSLQRDLSRHSVKVKLDLGSCRTVNVDHPQGAGKCAPLMVQALFRVAVKNGLPLFTFAVDNSNDILAATLRKLGSGKKDGIRWIYTFFTIREMKKKNSSWLNQGSKDSRNHGYVPNVVAQMKASDYVASGDQCTTTREFVLVATKNDKQRVNEELGATVLNLPNKRSSEPEPCGISVILPDGDHGLPSEGEPSPLLDRWRSGGSCDCGGWDLGCRLKVIASQETKPETSSGKFQLHSQNQELNRKPSFSMSPLKDGIYSVEFESSVKLIQAFSICIAILNGHKSTLSEAEWQADSLSVS